MWNEKFATLNSVGQIEDDQSQSQFDRTDNPKLRGYSTGVSYYQSTVAIRQITGGASHKYMAGEKLVSSDKYLTGDDPGDNDWLWTGWDHDLYRTAGVSYSGGIPKPSTPSPMPPQRDMPSSSADTTTRTYAVNMWDSPHAAGFNMVFATARSILSATTSISWSTAGVTIASRTSKLPLPLGRAGIRVPWKRFC